MIARGIAKNDDNLGGSKRAVHTQEILPTKGALEKRSTQQKPPPITNVEGRQHGKEIYQLEDHSISETVNVSEDKVGLLFRGGGR